jgi:hypothetical protein
MEQRRLRLGDILDDYCPRERRVTNHAVVAMIEENVKQTRCTTCDAEHPYKGGQAPRRKRKEAPAALYKEVLAGKPDTDPVAAAPAADAAPRGVDTDAIAPGLDETRDEPIAEPEPFSSPVPRAADEKEPESADADVDADLPRVPDVEEGPVHRPLIRATLPRPEGQKDARPLPEFTVRQSGGRGGNNAGNQQFRGGNRPRHHGGGGQGGNGHRPHGGARFANPRPGQGQGRGQGGNFRSAQQPRHGGGGRKRSR